MFSIPTASLSLGSCRNAKSQALPQIYQILNQNLHFNKPPSYLKLHWSVRSSAVRQPNFFWNQPLLYFSFFSKVGKKTWKRKKMPFVLPTRKPDHDFNVIAVPSCLVLCFCIFWKYLWMPLFLPNLCNRNKSTLCSLKFIESLLCSGHYAKFIKVSDLILTPPPHFLNEEIDPKSLRGTCSGYIALKFLMEFRLDVWIQTLQSFSVLFCPLQFG